jgi:hypothetical protein
MVQADQGKKQNSIPKIATMKKAQRVAQMVDSLLNKHNMRPEFKLQYCQKMKRKKKNPKLESR